MGVEGGGWARRRECKKRRRADVGESEWRAAAARQVGMAQSGLRRVLQRTSRQPGEGATDSSSNVVRQHGANAQVEEWRGEERRREQRGAKRKAARKGRALEKIKGGWKKDGDG
jgi:hypothetical protein